MTTTPDRHGPTEDLPKLSPSLLRDPASACPRRVALAHAGRKGDAQSDARWAVSDALSERARLAQLEYGPPDPAAFTGAVFPTAEQERVYAHVVSWYLALYGDRPGRMIDLGDAQWGRDRPDLGVRLTSRTPLVLASSPDQVRTGDEDTGREGGSRPGEGAHELRILRFGGDPVPGDLLADTEVRIGVARVAGDIVEGALLVSVADLVRGERDEVEIAVDDVSGGLDAWIAVVLDDVRGVADRETVRSGAECSWCSYVAGCPAHGG